MAKDRGYGDAQAVSTPLSQAGCSKWGSRWTTCLASRATALIQAFRSWSALVREWVLAFENRPRSRAGHTCCPGCVNWRD